MPTAVAMTRRDLNSGATNAKTTNSGKSTAACGFMSSEYVKSTQARGIRQANPSGKSVERSSKYAAPSANPAATESTCPHEAEMKMTAGFKTKNAAAPNAH